MDELDVAVDGLYVNIVNLTQPSRIARIALFVLLFLVLGFVGLTLWASKMPLFDPDPKGEGSYKEADTITSQFREYFRTRDPNSLPSGYVRLKGFGEDDLDGTWIVYYATASHAKVRGGTIGLLSSDGIIDIYFGHHCSHVNGGKLGAIYGAAFGDYFEGGIPVIREAFNKAFKHHKTEQAGTGQSATRSQSKSEVGDKPQPEAEGRSR